MIEEKDILSLNYYRYNQPFSGSFQGMRYRIIRVPDQKDEDGNVTEPEMLEAVIWPEPFSFEKTADELKTSRRFPFTEEGHAQVTAWLNAEHEKGDYHPGFTLSELKKIRNL